MTRKIISTAIYLALLPTSVFATDVDVETQLAQLQQQLALQQKAITRLTAQLAEQQQQKTQLNDINVVTTDKKKQSFIRDKSDTPSLTFKSYGTLAYRNDEIFDNIQDISPDRRATTDLERVVTEFEYQINKNWQIEFEIEYEHGGTGTTLEYDGFEEFGEFESEVEAGGEVIVEKLQVKYEFNPNVQVKFGHIYVPVGLGTDLNKPDQYFTTSRHWSEASMIPQVWHETGVNLITNWQDFTLQTMISTGLNSEYFRTTNWIAGGAQQRFETNTADDLALTLRLDYGDVKKGKGVGISYYNSDTSGNRRNQGKLDVDGNVSILGVHGAWEYQDFTLRGQYLYGELEDSVAITNANKTTPGLRPGSFSQLGSKSESAFFEAAYNTQHMFNLSSPLYVFTSFDYANPLLEVAKGTPIDRFDISEFSMGINYLPNKNLILKFQGGQRQYAQSNIDNTTHFSASIGYIFSTTL
ncbi:hypothetical protein HJP15_00220 [Pseudoalteromonas sp. NEC-BIFX-2020_002]|nr:MULTISPECIES: hypothetical protein [Pseudoalteromonas]NMR25702.1 hypothetical protein [Pseudoalteromonas sp. NEC-BIFX-2020_015]NNG41376.1 hypothetical protein [Pseudoalteromonas sp. NEC-BIFX-2020_002]